MPLVQDPTYFLAPNWTFKPGGKLNLGNIIIDPFKPHIALSKTDPGKASPTDIIIQRDWWIGLQTVLAMSLGIWTVFLEKVNLSFSVELGRSKDYRYAMSSLNTVYYSEDPSDEEIKARCNDPKVREFMRLDSVLCKPVYMVTGLKVARDFKVEAVAAKSHGGSLEAGGEVAPEASVGGNSSIKRETCWELGFSADDDIIFAYQLIKIKPKGWGTRDRKIVWTEFQHKKAFLADDDGQAAEQPPVDGEKVPVTCDDLKEMGAAAELVQVDGAWVAVAAPKQTSTSA